MFSDQQAYRELMENMLVGGVGFVLGSITTYILGKSRGYRVKVRFKEPARRSLP